MGHWPNFPSGTNEEPRPELRSLQCCMLPARCTCCTRLKPCAGPGNQRSARGIGTRECIADKQNSKALFLAKQESLTIIWGKRVTQAVQGCDTSPTAGSGRAKETPAVAVRPGGLRAFALTFISVHSIYSPDLLYNTPQLLDDASGAT